MIEGRLSMVTVRFGLPLLALLMLGANDCCNPMQPPDKMMAPPPKIVHGDGSPPRIIPPSPDKRVPLRINEKLLPRGARAHLPALDGDSFFVTLPVAQRAGVTTGDVAQRVVEPLLAALGFDRGLRGLRPPPPEGIKQPVANFRGLVQQVLDEYGNNRKLLGARTQELLEAFASGRGTPAVDAALQVGEGMTFDQFVAGIERLEIQFPFQQIEPVDGQDVAIEHTQLIASRWDLQDVTTVRGTLFNSYSVVNRRTLSPDAAVQQAIKALGAIQGIDRVTEKRTVDGPHLVLLPYGGDGTGAHMRLSWRMILRAVAFDHEGPFLLWLDAETGQILQLDPLFSDVAARGRAYNRDPGVGTATYNFAVDNASSSQYVLRLAGVLNRVDYNGDGFNAQDVTISETGEGSSSALANFDQPPINDSAQALCNSGTNKAFQQVNFFASLHRYYANTLSLGIFMPFPITVWDPKVQSASAGCNAWSDMDYGACEGYYNSACPNYTTGTNAPANYMNFAHDNTVVAHELAHNVTPRQTSARPANWCCAPMATCTPACAVPVGWGNFHDLADFWADHWENTNCTAGWVSKNKGGVDNSLNCSPGHFEDGSLPRRHLVTVPFNPAAPEDHFPEHRASGNTCDYCDMQIGAAVLWQVRTGMRSKCRPSGVPQFAVRFNRALRAAGFSGFAAANTDTGIYRQLYDLELELVDQWATSGSPMGPPAFAHNGPHTTNKVTAGFARAGLFLLPPQCLDGNNSTADPTSCPSGEDGADAVVDIDDNTPEDDLTAGGVTQPEHDFLRLGGRAPTFHVWTGSRFRLSGASGGSTLTNPAPCNSRFRVEVSTDPEFPMASTIMSEWTTVDRNPGTAESPECYGTFTPSEAQWTALQRGGPRIYYRARTRNDADGNERLSTTPGNGLWSVPPPYAVITSDGRSDY